MARKSTDKLKPRKASDEQHVRYLAAMAAVDRQWAKVNAIKCEKSTDKNWPAFEQALSKVSRLQSSAFKAYDAWVYAQRHEAAEEARKADPMQSNVPKEDAKALIAEALSESAAELQWNLKSVGLVAHKLTEATYGFVVREESQEVPLCLACL